MMQTLIYNGSNNNNKEENSHQTNGTTTTTLQQNGGLDKENTSNYKSDFERLIYRLRNDPLYRKEIITDKLIGFYKIGSEIGTGNFSQVRLGLHLLTRDKIAIKILNKTKLDEKTQRLLLREITSMQMLHHPNIIRLYEVIHTPTRLYICMEYAPDGELYTRINDHGKIKESESKLIFSQIISAVYHMHSINIIHRDIKAENIFFSNTNPLLVKIGDFGFSTEASIDKMLNTYCGSPPYAAPELFRDDHYTGIYVDVWALGVLLFFMVTGVMPFKAETVSKLKRVILNGEYVIPAFVSDSCQLLIKGILKPVPSDRFSIREIIDSAWLDGEKFSTELEPYQLHLNTQDSKLETKEEIYTKKVLEKLGITNELLAFSNLKEPNGYTNSYESTYGKSNLYMRNLTSTQSRNNSLESSNSLTNSSHAQLNHNSNMNNKKFEMITHDIKQSINGTFRIVFHKLQKKMRNEYNSEEMAARQITVNGNGNVSNETISSSANGTNLTLTKLEKRNYHKDSISSRSSSRDEEQNKYSNNNNNNNMKQNGNIEQNANNLSQQPAPKSIFVRLNSNPAQTTNKNIQLTNRRISEVSEASIYQIDRNRNDNHKVYANGNINSNMSGNNARNYKYQHQNNQNGTNANNKQSKLCMIL